MYSTNYTWKSFDPITSKLTVEVSILWNDALVEIRDIRLTLPVDDLGYATTDTGIIDSIVNERIFRYLPDVVNNTRTPPGGVVNAQLLYLLTSDSESDELVPGTAYVLLTADPDFTDGSNVCTRSVITVITNRLNIARPPAELSNLIVTGLDNGNVVSSTGLLQVQTAGESEQAGPFEITAANDNTDTLPVAPWVYTVYPDFLDNVTVTPEQGFDGYQYYIEHDPIVINGTATALFSY